LDVPSAGAVDSAVACLVEHGAVAVGAVERLNLSESLDITQRYWTRAGLTGAECEQQLGDWDQFAGRMLRASTDFDVVIGPVVGDVAPTHRQLVGEDYVFTLPWSLTGWPALSLPFGVDLSTGLPLAVQVAAPRWNDHVVLATAAVLEKSVAQDVR
jgi:Asp-tRNA(Asn)/Glu-tRNA(Gln) amidotransferase A subunit family amidase